MEATRDNLAYQEKRKIEDMNNQLKLENRVNREIFTRNNFEASQNPKITGEAVPKRPENDSRLSNFVRGFRREKTDFFHREQRHSAAFDQSPANISPQKMQRSSAIFQRNRQKGEPVLTDFIKRDNSLGKRPQEPVRMRQPNNPDIHQLRRERTESVIFVSPRNQNVAQFNPTALQQVKAENMGNTFASVFSLDPFFMLIDLYFLSLKHVALITIIAT